MTVLLYRDPYIEMTLDRTRSLVRVARTDRAYESIEVMSDRFDAMAEVLRSIDTASHVALLDLRAARGRSEPEFERVASAASEAMLRAFSRCAVLVASAVGRLQVARIEKERGNATFTIFTSEADALAYLLR